MQTLLAPLLHASYLARNCLTLSGSRVRLWSPHTAAAHACHPPSAAPQCMHHVQGPASRRQGHAQAAPPGDCRQVSARACACEACSNTRGSCRQDAAQLQSLGALRQEWREQVGRSTSPVSTAHPLPLPLLPTLLRYYGCGTPLPSGIEGLRVLDLGSGTGRDCYVAARMVGESGFVTGEGAAPLGLRWWVARGKPHV